MNQINFNSRTKIWSGAKHFPIYNSNVGLGYLILKVLQKTPDRITQVSADTNVEITCHEMRMRTMKIVTHLMNSGFKQGDIVGVMATNSENLASVVFACLTLGMPVNFIAPVMTENDVIYMFSKLKPKIIFCDSNLIETMNRAVNKMKLNTVVYTFVNKIAKHYFVDDLLTTAVDGSEFM
jgi:4-coumarate--CoA ligase